MNWPTVRTLLANDLRLLLRSKRTIFISVILPLLIWPLMLWLSSLSMQRQEQRAETAVYSYSVVGPQSEMARQRIALATSSNRSQDEEQETAQTDTLRPAEEDANEAQTDDATEPGHRFEEASHDDPRGALEQGELDLLINAYLLGDASTAGSAVGAVASTSPPPSDDSALLEETFEDPQATSLVIENGGSSGSEEAQLPADTLVLELVTRDDIDASQRAGRAMRGRLQEARQVIRAQLLRERGFSIAFEDLAGIETVDTATAAQSSGLALGRFLTAMLLMFLMSGGSIVAMDTLAGEKERGTLETLLTTAATRLEIVAAKSLAIFSVALTITIIQLLDLLVFVGLGVLPLPEGFTIPITPAIALLLLVLFLPMAALLSSVLLLVSGYSRSYKEAQLLFFPVFVVTILPSLVVILPGIKLRSAIAFIPIANMSVAVKEILSGSFDWPMISIAWLINAALAAWMSWMSIRALSSERLVTANDYDEVEMFGGPKLLGRHVLRWYAVLWALLLVWQLNASPEWDIRMVLMVNMTAMVGTALLLLRKYRVPRQLAIPLIPGGQRSRGLSPLLWLGVLVGGPAGLLVSSLVARASTLFFEIPDEVLERFAEQLIPPEQSLLMSLFFFAIVPGICEELCFRGTLLFGLRQRYSAWLSVLLCGLIFGAFHISLFRLAPTAFLGVMLAAVTLRTGSVLPAMVWHALHNGTSILLDHYQEQISGIDTTTPAVAAVVVLAVALLMIWGASRKTPEIHESMRA